MKIILHPQRRDLPLTLTKAGDVLTFNGEAFDFSALPAGATLPADAISSDWITGKVERDEAGALIVPVALPHGPTAPEATRFPAPLENVPDGTVALPIYDEPAEEPQA
ncbi:hypothetical protein [Salipiger abyssi]|uniref:Phage protein n=1 Tax=Salipiger abyssi TaxID=1250539 RepID=A0A1P8UP83_9RHOB|nr:hypothetical protein [Salipiger abyssi]APZ51214.1 Phage protein [Salipiger abyssi]